MGKVMKVLGAVGAVVDKVVPFAKGNRTSISVLLVALAEAAQAAVPFIPPPYGPAVQAGLVIVGKVLAVVAPAFAVAHVARDKA